MTIQQKLNKEVATLLTAPRRLNGRVTTRRVTYGELLSDRMLMIDAIRRGIPYTLFDLIRNVAPFSDGDWSSILDLSPKSLQRYKKETKTFRPIHSEKIIEMAEVTDLGEKVFGDKEKFKSWLNSQSLALGNIKPIELLQHSYGKDLVVRELIHIEHGIFA